MEQENGINNQESAKKSAKPVTTYRKLLAFGKKYGVNGEEDFKAAAMTYAEEAQLIATMRETLAQDGMTVKKEYVKGRENICVHPLVTEIPKHVDCANRILSTIGDIVVKRGKKSLDEEDELKEFRL